MKKHMVIYASVEDNDLKIKDFGLTLEEAEILAKSLNDEGYETVCICKHGKFEY